MVEEILKSMEKLWYLKKELSVFHENCCIFAPQTKYPIFSLVSRVRGQVSTPKSFKLNILQSSFSIFLDIAVYCCILLDIGRYCKRNEWQAKSDNSGAITYIYQVKREKQRVINQKWEVTRGKSRVASQERQDKGGKSKQISQEWQMNFDK